MNSFSDATAGSDDLFANSSAETVVENIDFSVILKEVNLMNLLTTGSVTCNKNVKDKNNTESNKEASAEKNEISVLINELPVNKSLVANRVVKEVCNVVKLYCPFCCNYFTSESSLKEHLKQDHEDHMKKISINDANSYFFHSCRYCHANYYTTDLLTKHFIQDHQDNIVTIFQEKFLNKHIICGFCPYEVLIENKQHLAAHVEENHFTEFKTLICKQFSYKNSETPPTHHDVTTTSNIFSLSTSFKEMNMNKNADHLMDNVNVSVYRPNGSILQLQNKNTLSADNKNSDEKEEYNITIENRPCIKKKLRFGLLEKPNLKKSDKEDIISCSSNLKLVMKSLPKSTKDKKVSKWKSAFSFKIRKSATSKPVSRLVASTPNALNDLHSGRRKRYSRPKLTSYRKKSKETKTATRLGSIKTGLENCIKKEETAKHAFSTEELEDTSFILATEGNKLYNSLVYDTEVPVSKLQIKYVGSENLDVPKRAMTNLPLPSIMEVRKDSACSWTPPEDIIKQFKCAICLKGFVNNVDLLCHTSQNHTGPLKLLQPSYKCGQCEAKFYKNSFLVRHCKYHHTPRCLKSQLSS